MLEAKVIEFVERMTVHDKMIVYMNYFVNMTACKHDFEIYDTSNSLYPEFKLFPFKTAAKADVVAGGIAMHRHCKQIRINTFDEFCNPLNAERRNHGENWKENGFAAEEVIIIHPGSIYHYVQHNIL